MRDIPAPRKYPPELRERAIRMTVEARRHAATRDEAIARAADQLGVDRETLRNRVAQAEVDAGHRPDITTDQAQRLSAHARFALETGTKVFFADPHSPWQRPTNENTNGLLRQYFPKDSDLSRWSFEDLEAVALAVNNRHRKVLGWRTPAEVFAEQLRSPQQPDVATTG
jgi:IS30 family transposase